VDKILPRLKKIPIDEARRFTGLSRRQMQRLKNGKSYPAVETLEKLKAVINKGGKVFLLEMMV
jgi:hypothetical protein